MEVRLDLDRCESFAACVTAAPTVFGFDDEENVAVLLEPNPSPNLVEDVRAAVRDCPVRAISLIGGL